MRRSINRRALRPFFAIVLLLVAIHVVVAIPYPAEAQEIKPVADIVKRPLPSVPEPVVRGGSLKVLIDATPDASGWTARLSSKYGSSSLTIINSSYTENQGWTLFFNVPATLYPELYALNVAFSQGGGLINYTQPRSVWVLEDWPEKLTIGHITDIHLPYGADILARSVYELNLLQPDMAIATGDIVDVETLASAWVYYQRITEWLEIPSYILPGNHDHAGTNGTNYQRFCGPLYYSVDIGNFLFIALDTMEEGYVTASQLRWAEGVLERHPNKVKIMGIHHPLFGRGDGGNLSGTWEEIEKLKEDLYFSWEEHLDEAREFLRLVEEYDVRLILAGHIHRDHIVIYNGKHHFVTKSPTGGSLREGDYQSYRLVEIDMEGNVWSHTYAEKGLFAPPNSIPLGYVTYYYSPANDGTKTAVSVIINNYQEQEVRNAKVEFIASIEYNIEDYTFHPTTPTHYETLTTEKGHYFIAYMNVSSKSVSYLTLAAVEDEVEPTVEVNLLEEIREEAPIALAIRVTDEGWGVREVVVEYSTNEGTTWTSVDSPLILRVGKDEYEIEYPTAEYEVTIPGQTAGTELLVRVKAWDFAENIETYQATYTIGAPPAPPPPP
ncbi:MAG: metallophosphoesterase family protein, partial [Candidatus Bathyarchaeia archaeon]